MARFLVNKKVTCGYRLKMDGLSCRDYNKKVLLNLNAVIAGYDTTLNSTLYGLVFNNNYMNIDNVYFKTFDLQNLNNDITNVGTTCYCTQLIQRVDINFLTKNETIQEVDIDYYYEDAPGDCNGGVTTVPLTMNINFVGYQKVIIKSNFRGKITRNQETQAISKESL
jgi:hypothetical protein